MNKKLLWVDNLRAFATFSVIVLHVSAPILYKYSSISDLSWWIGNIYDSSVRFCVPIFLMLSGALMYSKTYELSDFFKKRFARILFPFIFWSLVYISHDLSIKWYNGDIMTMKDIAVTIFLKTKNGASYHLWYIYMLIGVYLIFPVFQKWINNSSKKEIIYYLLIWGIVIIIGLPLVSKFKPNVDLRYFSGFLGYTILGYFLAVKVEFHKKIIPLLFLLIGIITTIFGTYILTKSSGHFSGVLYGYLTPNVIIASVGLFLLFKNIKLKNALLIKTISLISKYSYGIYLSHVIVLFYLSKLGVNWTCINPLVGIPITAVTCLIISLFLTLLINKLPLGKMISG